jgi:hypothetical protein
MAKPKPPPEYDDRSVITFRVDDGTLIPEPAFEIGTNVLRVYPGVLQVV